MKVKTSKKRVEKRKKNDLEKDMPVRRGPTKVSRVDAEPDIVEPVPERELKPRRTPPSMANLIKFITEIHTAVPEDAKAQSMVKRMEKLFPSGMADALTTKSPEMDSFGSLHVKECLFWVFNVLKAIR